MIPVPSTLEIKTAPAVQPVSLADCKAHMRVTSSAEDDVIQGYLDAAIEMIDAQGMLGKAMITQTWYQWAPRNPGTVTLWLGPVQSVDAVSYYDTDGQLQSATLSDFAVYGTANAKTIRPDNGKSWPNVQERDDAIRIEYTVGFGDEAGDVPSNIRQAIKMLVAHWEQQRQAGSENPMSSVPFGVEPLLNINRGSWYG